MKFTAALLALAGSASAFSPFAGKAKTATAVSAFTIDEIPGALEPVGLFDPLGFAAKADEPTLKRYREAELTHGRVAMLAVSTNSLDSTISVGRRQDSLTQIPIS